MTNLMRVSTSPTGEQIATKTVHIDAPTAKVWEALTNPNWMKIWMSETEIQITTDWIVGHPIWIQGTLHRVKFRNQGTVLRYEREQVLAYSHLSSLSRLPDEPENYAVFTFVLTPADNQTDLTLTLSNFATEAISKHLVFYWNVTLELLKKFIEQQA